jgi:hypothetical protein
VQLIAHKINIDKASNCVNMILSLENTSRSEKIMTQELKKFAGAHTEYTEVARRGTEETLGVSLSYGVREDEVGCVAVRFASRGMGGKFTHFTPRFAGKFLEIVDDHRVIFGGLRLNLEVIPVLKPGPPITQVLPLFANFEISEFLASWVTEQIKEEGFELLTEDLVAIVNEQLFGPPTENVEFAVELPNLKLTKAAAQKEQGKSHESKQNSEETDFDA